MRRIMPRVEISRCRLAWRSSPNACGISDIHMMVVLRAYIDVLLWGCLCRQRRAARTLKRWGNRCSPSDSFRKSKSRWSCTRGERECGKAKSRLLKRVANKKALAHNSTKISRRPDLQYDPWVRLFRAMQFNARNKEREIILLLMFRASFPRCVAPVLRRNDLFVMGLALGPNSA